MNIAAPIAAVVILLAASAASYTAGARAGRNAERERFMENGYPAENPPWVAYVRGKDHLGRPVCFYVCPYPLRSGGFVVNLARDDNSGTCQGVVIPSPWEEIER